MADVADEPDDFDLDLTGRRRDDPTPGYALRLRGVSRLCARTLAATVVLLAVLSWTLTREAGGSGGRPRTCRRRCRSRCRSSPRC